MIEGLDYSWGRPDLACLYGKGKRFVVRYVTHGSTSGKNLTPAEADRIRASGLNIVAVHQEGKSTLLQGFAKGVESAKSGLAQATLCGMPAGRPIYFALDIDPNPLTTSQWSAVKAFLDGAASVLGRSRVGIYGGRKAIDTLVPTWAPWGWQTYAWSGGVWSSKAHLQQYNNNVTVCNGLIDHDRATTNDYGQWSVAVPSLANIAPTLRAAGLTVVELPGWKTRTRPGSHAPKGFLCHHTAGSSDSQAYVEWMTYEGRASEGIPGPLCQIALSRKGIVYLCAAGRANHAGKCRAVSNWLQAGDGNTQMVGCEALHRGGTEPWTTLQYETYVTLAATVCDFMGWPRSRVLGHKETSLSGKVDPTFNMTTFRARVAAFAGNGTSEDNEMDATQAQQLAEIHSFAKSTFGAMARFEGNSAPEHSIEGRVWRLSPDGTAVRQALGRIDKALEPAAIQASVAAAVQAATADLDISLSPEEAAALAASIAGAVNDTVTHAVNISVTQD